MKLLVTAAFGADEEDLKALEERGHEVFYIGDERGRLPDAAEDVEGIVCNSLFLYHEIGRFPKLKLLLGHMGGTYQGCMSSIELAKQYENVYLDINGSLYSQIWIEELAKFAPHEKLIFSTDQAFNDPRIIVGRVLLSDLDDALKRRILCENFEAAIDRTLLPA